MITAPSIERVIEMVAQEACSLLHDELNKAGLLPRASDANPTSILWVNVDWTQFQVLSFEKACHELLAPAVVGLASRIIDASFSFMCKLPLDKPDASCVVQRCSDAKSGISVIAMRSFDPLLGKQTLTLTVGGGTD